MVSRLAARPAAPGAGCQRGRDRLSRYRRSRIASGFRRPAEIISEPIESSSSAARSATVRHPMFVAAASTASSFCEASHANIVTWSLLLRYTFMMKCPRQNGAAPLLLPVTTCRCLACHVPE